MSSSNKQDKALVKTTSVTHVIENYQNSSSKHFPNFKLSSKNRIRFGLSCHPNHECKFYNANYTIILLALKPNDTHQITVRYRISLLNSNGDKCWTQEGIVDVSTKTTQSAYFGHFQILRSYVLDPVNKLLVNNNLSIYCELEEFDVKSQSKQELTNNPVLKNYQSLLEVAKFSDAVLIIGKNELPVHKAILGAQSKVFAAMFENDCKEKRQNRVEITDISVDVCKQMLRYIYTGIVEELDEFAAELFVTADKYELDYLKEACEQHMATSIETDSVANILLVADMHNASLLKTKCVEFVIKHGKEVIASEGWKVLTKARPELVIQLFEQIYNQK